MKTTTNPEPLCARLAFNAPESAAGEFMYMPAGRHVIQPTQGGRAVEVEVEVDAKSATALQQQKEAVEARTGQRCYFDFDHDDGAASFWPRRFSWRENAPAGAGVYVAGEWSKPGKEAIEGKSFRSFSPTFHVDDVQGNPARIICNPAARLNMGGLVNCPAFHENAAFFSKDAGGKSSGEQQQQQRKSMLKSKEQQNGTTLDDSQDLQAKLNARDEQIQKYRERDADRAIEAACARGAIPPANAAIKAKWRAAILENPENEVLLAEIPGASVLSQNGLTRAATATAAAMSARESSYGIMSREGPKRVIAGWSELVAKQHKVQGMGSSHFEARGEIARDMATFFENEIQGRKDVLNMPLMAATTGDDVGTLVGTLVVQRTLPLFRYRFPLLSKITTDFSDQPGVLNQTETTRIVVTPSVQTYNNTVGADGRPAGWDTVVNAKTTDVSISLDEHVGVPIVFSQNTLAGTIRRLLDEQSPAQLYALEKYFVDKIYALYTAANYNAYAAVSAKVPNVYATYPAALGDFARSRLTEIESAFDMNEVPQDDRFLLLIPQWYAKLANDPSLVTFWAGQQNPEMITKTQLPELANFSPIKAPNFPTTANRVGFAGQKYGTLIKSRLPNDLETIFGSGAAYGMVTTITTPDTGFSVYLVQYVERKAGYAEQRLQVLLGAAKADNRAGLVITSQ